jgi:uncharacterized protein YjbI with pentapeptide repeats
MNRNELIIEAKKHLMLLNTSFPRESVSDREKILNRYAAILFSLLSLHQKEWARAMGSEKENIQYAIIRNIEEFNRLRKLEVWSTHDGTEIPFRDLSFKRFFLRNVDLSTIDCSHSDFTQSMIEHGSFRNSSCSETSFFNTNISHTTFHGANCKHANFKHAKCRSTLFTQANIQSARFDQSHLKRASFRKAKCTGTHFDSANCMNTDFESSRCIGTSFHSTNCEFANFVSMECRRVDFRAANLRNTMMDEYTVLEDCQFYRARLEGSELKIARKQFYDGFRLKTIPEERSAEEHAGSEDHETYVTRAQDTYRNLKKYFSSEGLHNDAGAFHIRERLMGMSNLRTQEVRARKSLQNFLRFRKPSCGNDPTTFGEFIVILFGALFSRNGRLFSQVYRRSGYFFTTLRSKFSHYLESRMFLTYNEFLYKNGSFGEKPYFIVLLWFKVIVLYAIVYLVTDIPFNSIKNASFSENGVIDYLYFSMVTFTTLGYGDLKPLGYMRLVASSEAIIGAILIAYFVVAWARKIFR